MLDKLYSYQLANAETLARKGFGCDLSEVGTGKTLTALGVMKILEPKTILVIAPKSVAHQWELKFNEFYPEMRVFRPKGSDKTARYEAYQAFNDSLAVPKVLIVTYEQARLDITTLQTYWGLILADECHRLGNPTTELYKAVRTLMADYKFGATATPLRSSPLQAYGIFNWLKPGSVGKNYWHFKAQYTVINQAGWVLGYKNLDKLAQVIAPYFVKTTMEEAGVFMPPLVEEDILFPLAPVEQKLYDNMRREMLLEIEAMEINKIENPSSLYTSVVKLGKMQEVTDSMELVGEKMKSSKIETLKDSLQNNLVGDNKAVIFSRFSRMIDILARELKDYHPAVITGATGDRQAEIDKLNNDPKCKVMLVTTAGNEGINLERANILYFVDVPLGSYGSLVQTIGRIKRIGQTKPMVVYYLQAENTVDIKLKKLLLKKQEMSERIFGSLAEIREVLE